MYVDTYGRARDHYRAIANELRLVVLRMKHPEAAEELRLLASNYERLAEWHAAAPDPCLETTGIAQVDGPSTRSVSRQSRSV